MSMYFEDFEVGALPVVTPERQITEADVLAFAQLSGDNNPLHINEAFARSTPMGQRVAHGLLVLSIATGLSAQAGQLQGTALAFLGMEQWQFHAPVFFGDRIHLRWSVAEKRPTSKGNAGMVKRRMEIFNQKGELVQSGLFATLVRTRG